MTTAVLKEYDVHLDSKRRVTLRGTTSDYYAVRLFSDGTVMLEPRVLTHPANIPAKVLRMMDKAVRNLKRGNASPAIDLSRYTGKAGRA
jgi:hypothetical protein